ncbi:MAG: tRNA pseudouridine(55) synthase TruB [Bacteroidetes bacterium MED-G20]|nr:MAG: tRNA pseudouridine(55) synthase TruB [Bacteroidetes bacterium MED-G20]|tara:strand:+ start:495 stop:1187 length:693 start_codon:yes stop_codon:yes gene_type:complete
MTKIPFVEGAILLVDKPLNWTSFDVVKKIRYEIINHFKIKKIKVGHAGTLDPLATGLIVLCTGKKTKTINELIIDSKFYEGEIRLGATTPSFDLETEIDKEFALPSVDDNTLKNIEEKFTGEINQLPPLFSAKRVKGKRAYEYARNNEYVELKPNLISIFELQLKIINKNTISFSCHCSKGTYMRSLARDIGSSLNSGAHLISLRRIKSGKFKIEMAKSIEEWIDIIKAS